jgi:hypothetical protein
VIRFACGMPESGARPLTGEERGRVGALRRALGRSALLRGLAVPAIAVAGAWAGAALLAARWPALAVAVFAGSAFGVAAALLALRDAVRERSRVARDLAAGEALLFARGTRSVEVLAHARRVLARDGAPADLAERAPMGSAAAPPAEARTWAVAADEGGGALELGLVRRALTPEERDEIRRHASRLRRIPGALVAATALGGAGLGAWLARRGAPGGGNALLWAAVIALTWWRALGARRLAARLREDEADGWVLRATAGDRAGTEVLPASRARWTARGAPAPWRLLAPPR